MTAKLRNPAGHRSRPERGLAGRRGEDVSSVLALHPQANGNAPLQRYVTMPDRSHK
jgi:hypothetical protein